MYLPGIGRKIRILRNQRKLSQKELGEMIGASKSVISSYENDVHLPSYDTLIRLSRIFGVSTDYLLGMSEHREVNVDGLTEAQIEVILQIINELKHI